MPASPDPAQVTRDNGVLLRLGRLHTALVADVLDHMGAPVAFLGGAVRPLHPGRRIVGNARTLRTEGVEQVPERPYERLLAVFPTIRRGDVLVVGGGSDSTAGLWGGLLSTAARAKGAAGAVIDGLSRDVDEIERLGFPVFARGASPLDSAGRQEVTEVDGRLQVAVGFVHAGDVVLGDSMGVIAFSRDSAEEAVQRAEEKSRGEATVRDELDRGVDVSTLFERHGIL
jgi:4-hydroxy-4-methyl-2-oxoglutarate aldolase